MSRPTEDLRRRFPGMSMPIHCDNGCGAVLELGDAFESYKRGDDGKTLFICPCCAAEEGHLHEEWELPEDAPACCRKAKKKLW